MTLFGRFFVDYHISPDELWWTDIKDGSRQWHLFDLSIIERRFEGGSYKALQIVILNLAICIADNNSFQEQWKRR